MTGVGHHRERPFAPVERHLDGRPGQPAEHRLGLGEGGVQVEDHRPERLLAGERQELPGQRRGPVARPVDLADELDGRVVGRQTHLDDFAIAVDDGEQVVEVVGHAAGQEADDFHFLGLPQPLFERLDGRNVGLNADEVGDAAGGVAEGADRQGVPERRAVLLIVDEDDAAPGPATNRLANRVEFRRRRVRPLEEAAVAADDFLVRVAGQLLEPAVAVDDRVVRPGRVRHDQPEGHGLDRPDAHAGPIVESGGALVAGQPLAEAAHLGEQIFARTKLVRLRTAATRGRVQFLRNHESSRLAAHSEEAGRLPGHRRTPR